MRWRAGISALWREWKVGTYYKYTSVEDGLFYYLCRQEVCFTALCNLNDPFEAGLDLSDMVKEQEQDVSARFRATVLERTGMEARYDYEVLKLMKQDSISAETWDAMMCVDAWRVMQRTCSIVGVLSLSTKPTINLLWSHYAHLTGLALGFSSQSKALTDSRLDETVGIQAVNYKPLRRKLRNDGISETIRSMCLTKSFDWENEAEVRCFRAVQEGSPRTVVKFDRGDLTSIVMGCQMSVENALRVREIALEKYPSAKLKIAYPLTDVFEMRVCPAPVELDDYRMFFTDNSAEAMTDQARE